MDRAVITFLLGALISVASARPAHAVRVHGAALLDQAVKVDDSRYRSQRDWDRTVRFFNSVYRKTKGVVFRTESATPRVKLLHIENTNVGQGWEGINIYETGGKVYIYVIKSDVPDTKKGKKASKGDAPSPKKKGKKASRKKKRSR